MDEQRDQREHIEISSISQVTNGGLVPSFEEMVIVH